MINPIDPNSIVSGSENKTPEQDNDSIREVNLVLGLLERGKEYRSQFDNDWEKRIDFYKGKQWKDKSQNRSRPVMNIIRQTIQSTIPIITDRDPGFGVLGRDPTDYEFAKEVGELIDVFWDNSSMQHTLAEVIFDSMLLDAGILKVVWDPDLEDGIGDVKVERIDPRDIYVPQGATDFTKNCGWVIQKSKKQIGELRRKFPDKVDVIKADDTDNTKDNTGKSMEIEIMSPIDRHVNSARTIGESSDCRKLVDVIECWIDDETLIEEYRELENGDVEKTVRKKFPKGKVITVLPGKKVLLQSTESPYAHGMKPFVRIVDAILPGEFWGEGECGPLMHTQILINKVLQHIFDVYQLMSNPLWIIKKGCGVQAQQITNRVSQVLEINMDVQDPVKREFPPSLQTGSLDLYQMLIRQTEAISGIAEISQGRKPTGVTAAAAIETLQEASQTRVRMKERNLQPALSQLGKLVIALFLQFYRETRVVRITNNQGKWPEYREFYVEEMPDNQYIIHRRRYVFDPESQRYIPEPSFTSTPPSKGLMDVKVMSGTSLPWAKTTQSNIAFRLFDSQVIDAEELLKTLEWPDSDKVIQRMQKKQEEMAAQQPPPPPPKQ